MQLMKLMRSAEVSLSFATVCLAADRVADFSSFSAFKHTVKIVPTSCSVLTTFLSTRRDTVVCQAAMSRLVHNTKCPAVQ